MAGFEDGHDLLGGDDGEDDDGAFEEAGWWLVQSGVVERVRDLRENHKAGGEANYQGSVIQ